MGNQFIIGDFSKMIKCTEKHVLNNGVEIPVIGFGSYMMHENTVAEAVKEAIHTGYRLIDCASAYGNEDWVGKGIRDSGISRDEIFITGKVNNPDRGYEKTKASFEKTLKDMGLDHLDLYLIHQPMNDYYGSWRAMEELYEEGKSRAIGVCNFYPERLADLCLNVKVKPMVNQVELHPFFAQENGLEVMREFGVQPEAWGPLAEGKHGIFTHPVLTEIGAKYGKSAAQVALRWNVQKGVVIIPKSVHRERMEENLNIWDFRLDEGDMEAIAALDLGHSEIIDHSAAQTAKFLNGWKIHE